MGEAGCHVGEGLLECRHDMRLKWLAGYASWYKNFQRQDRCLHLLKAGTEVASLFRAPPAAPCAASEFLSSFSPPIQVRRWRSGPDLPGTREIRGLEIFELELQIFYNHEEGPHSLGPSLG